MDTEVQRQMNTARQAGFSDDEVQSWLTKKAQDARRAGFSPEEVQKSFGLPTEPNTSGIKAHFEGAFKGKPIEGIEDAVKEGFGMSVSALAFKKPSGRNLDAGSNLAERIAYGTGQLVGDIPFMIGGGLLGAGAGAPTGPGAIITGAAGAFGLPAGLRATLMDGYEKGDFKDPSDFAGRVMSIMWETAKGMVTGAATGGAGVAAKAVLPAATSAATKLLAPNAAELTTMVTVGKGLEGEIPRYQDFVDGAILFAGYKGSAHVVGKLRAAYKAGNIKPEELLDAANKDPTVVQDIVDENQTVPRSLATLAAERTRSTEPTIEELKKSYEDALEKYKSHEFSGRTLEPGEYHVKNLVESEAAYQAKLVAERVASGEEPPLKEGYIRLYRGEDEEGYPPAKDDEVGVWFAVRRETAKGYGDKLKYVDLPKEEALKYGGDDEEIRDTEKDDPGSVDYFDHLVEYILPEKFANAAFRLKLGRKIAEEDAKSAGFPLVVTEKTGLPATTEKNAVGAAGGGKPPNEPPGGNVFEHGDEGTPPKPPDMDAAAAEKKIGEQMAARPENPQEKITWNKLYTELKDKLDPIRRVMDLINKGLGRELPPHRDAYILMRELAGNSGKFKQVIEGNLYDTDTFKNIGAGFEARIEPVKGDIDKFQVYLLAKRALERMDKGFEVGISRPAAEAMVKEMEEKDLKTGAYLGGEKGVFQRTFDSLVDYQETVGRQFLVKSGIMSEEQFQHILAHSKDFVPLHRVYEELQSGKSDAFVWNPIKEFKGSNAKIVRPLESILRNTYLYIALGEKNRAGLALVEGIEALNRFQSGKSFIPDLEKPGVTDVGEQYTPVLKELAAPEGGKIILHGAKGEAPLMEQVENPSDMPMALRKAGTRFGADFAQTLRPIYEMMNLGEGDTITVFRNGQRITLKAAPDIAAVFHGLDAQSMGALMKMFAVPAAMLRAGVALVPEYAARNLFVDQLQAGVQSKSGYIPFLSAIRSIADIWGNTELYQRWLKSGGANVALVNMDSRYIESKFEQWGAQTGFFNRVWNSLQLNYKQGLIKGTAATVSDTAHALLAPLRVLSEMSDTLTRLGEMRAADGMVDRADAIAAAFETRNVTQDFLRMGSAFKAWNAVTAFANSQMEGVDNFVHVYAERPGATTFKIMGMVMLPSLMLWLANRDQKWYNDLPDYIRDNYWTAKVGEHIYKVRKPFEMGTIFGSGLERSLDYMFKDDPEAYKGFASNVWQNIWPATIPTFAQPVLEQMTNHSFFGDRSLVPASLEHVLPEYKYTPYTSEVAKGIASIIGFVPQMGRHNPMNPIVVDNYIREWSGGMGQYALQLADAALIAAKIVPDPVKPAWTVEDYPVIKAFMVRYPSNNTKGVRDFYDHYEDALKMNNTLKLMAELGNIDAALKISKLNEDIVKVQGIHDSLGNINQTIQTIYALPSIPPQEKRQLLETLYFNLTEIGREGAKTVHAINKELNTPRSIQ